MSKKAKVKRGLGRLNAPGLYSAGTVVVTSMTGNPFIKEPYPENVIPLPQVKNTLERFGSSCIEARSGAKQSVALRKKLRAQLIDELYQLAGYVDLVAKGDVEILASSGFEYTKETAPSQVKHQASCPDVELSQGVKRGGIVGKAKRAPRARSCEFHITTGDPTVEGNWKHAAVFGQFKNMELEGLTPGQQYALRMRWIMPEGPGPWTPPLFFMPT
ncbi:hypothetical protein [Geomonas subterranea]|uniref:Fibronectin type-III domain-containing protein n=1 Tax=Geomonas subterranea TaxID=2847989 RepID=A0ABX8LMV3_9BACT|nr:MULTISPECIES: hypothetical protein [Geomonas]QXE91568.1 hypothetical protein KP001_03195 [Geomonas subterranea]QXM10343.1 hypothetical protein KP002_04300 [Geomonas subterranea]